MMVQVRWQVNALVFPLQYFHCAMHYLNLSASEAIKVPAFRNAQVIIKDIFTDFRASAKRTHLLRRCIEADEDENVSKTHLITLCETIFLERHTAVVTLRELLKYVIEAIEEMKSWDLSDARKKDNSLESSICQTDFVVANYS